MKREYDRLQKKYNRHAKEVQREKTKTSTEIDDHVEEIKRLTTKLEVRWLCDIVFYFSVISYSLLCIIM